MKRNFSQLLAVLLLLITIISCRKEEAVSIDLKKYVDNPATNTALDAWLKTNFLDPYNIEVIYRYSDYYKDNDKVVAPVNPDRVQPQMQSVINGFINPYIDIAGSAFMKKMLPKQWILFGSGSYNSDGSSTNATAAAGRRITLYYVNKFNENNADTVARRLRTIHHEFTHILNQIVPMPTDFESITKATYNADWTKISAATAQAQGYVRNYAASQPSEDFAEMVSFLLVHGQAWFDNYANNSTTEGKAALKAKEASVVQYFTINLGIDFRALQQEVQNVIRNVYQQQSLSFGYWLGQNFFKTITVNLENPVYTENPISTEFETAYNDFKAAVLAYSATEKYHLDYIQLRFESTTKCVVRAAYTNAAGTQAFANYGYSCTISPTTGVVTFTRNTAYDSGTASTFLTAYTNSINAYLTPAGKTFTAAWLPATIDAANYNSFGGMYLTGTPTNNFFGSLGQTL